MPIKITSKVKDGTKKQPAAQKKPPLKYSGFWITIVANQVNGKDNKELDAFRKTIEEMFDETKLLEFIEGDHDKIVSVKADTSIELNTKRFPHAHCLIKIKHRTKTRIPYDKVRKFVADGIGVEPSSLHIYCRLVKDANFTIEGYINKHVKDDDAVGKE